MRIAFVTQWFPPETGTLVSAAIADGLGSRGHDVHVLTGFPNYPTGKLYDGYRVTRYLREQRSANVTVHRAPLIPSHDASAVRRATNYLSFSAGASWVARTRMPAPDVWLTYSSPATAAVPALTVPRRVRAPHLLLVQDLWPDSVTESGFLGGSAGRTASAALERFCDWTYRRSAGIGVISPGMRQILTDRGVPAEKIALVSNWIDDSHLHPAAQPTNESRAALGLPAGRLFVYAGNIGELQGLDALLDVFAQCPESTLVLIGDGVALPSLKQRVSTGGLTNVQFFASQPQEHIGAFLAAADVLVVSLRDTPLLRATMPSKVQASLAAARPVLAFAAGDAAQIVTDGDCGLAVPPGDVAAGAVAVRTLTGMPQEQLAVLGRNARGLYEREFSPQAGLDRMEAWLMGR